MKKVLSLLLVFVFLKAQALALSGGPVFPGALTSYIGVYSGVLVPTTTSFTTTGTASGGTSTSVGLFSMNQPDTGLATGALLLFIDGAPFSGVITGIIDPDTGSFDGVIDAASTFNVTLIVPTTTLVNGVPTTTLTTQSFQVLASGSLEAQIKVIGTATTVGAQTVTPSRITGNASVDVYFQINADGTPDVSKTANFDVEGFKQSDVGTTATTAPTFTGGGGGGTGA
jgi:hypothetical protein